MSATVIPIRPRINGVTRQPVSIPDVGRYWAAVDAELEAIGEPNAAWLEELAPLYAAGTPVGTAVRRIIFGRRPTL